MSVRSLFLQTFCKNIFKDLRIISCYCLQMSELSLFWFLRAFEISCYTNHDWTCVFRMGINCYLLSNHLYNWYIQSYVCTILLWGFWVRVVNSEVHFATSYKSNMLPFPAVLILEDIRVYIGTSNCGNVLTDVKAPIN